MTYKNSQKEAIGGLFPSLVQGEHPGLTMINVLIIVLRVIISRKLKKNLVHQGNTSVTTVITKVCPLTP